MSDVRAAELALHQRTGLACAAAGVPGRFRVWEHDGLLAVLATDPALGFLSTVSGVAPETLSALPGLLAAPEWDGVEPTVLTTDLDAPPAAGLVRAGERVLAVRRLGEWPEPESVVDADDTFVDVLLAGYEAEGVVAAFVAAEHRLPQVRRFFVVEDGTPIAAAAMTIHGEVAVLGGASTLPAHRGRGAQPRLLRHRLRVAADAGCVLAVATARAGSVSAANLSRAGFCCYRRSAWARA
ncbi:GNAT family N-acetyltransferase [Amycolatopsis sp., V23-08]|uniref:GNAT family N-acetyltransferase n=1 Tax=Amycolatopsis heterodermiae TaxID=3110235 RepID=A0ABU5RM10_9PSEU|nr:GNAT family N-acetyltransferase [Amycolatopsis sp., V23-08]MEA5367333.1 GNAT family N-acetyltransferase [Amycolatopsis sp., V23-08]